LATLSFKANFKTLGKKMGGKMKDAANDIAAFTRTQWSVLDAGGNVPVQGIDVVKEDVLLTRTARGDVVVASEGDLTVALDTVLDDALKQEGLVRDLVRDVQDERKTAGLAITDRVHLTIHATPFAEQAVKAYTTFLSEETLASTVTTAAFTPSSPDELYRVELKKA
jgi:isoleucyl-tRNA synthetase